MKSLFRFLIVAVLCFAGVIGIWFVFHWWPPREASGDIRPGKITAPPRPDYEAEAAKWNRTVWASEIKGQKLAERIWRLWDELRQSETPLQVLADLPFDQLTIGSFSSPQTIEHGIVIRETQEPATTYSRKRFQEFLTQRRRENIRLEQSQWRHERFWPERDGVPQSRFRFVLHARRPEPETRYILRGRLRIRWRETDARPAIETVTVTEAELLSRKGPPPFLSVPPIDITPDSVYDTIEPNLLIQDLDRDGLAEIVLPSINRVYRNQGQGRFRPAPLLEFPIRPIDIGTLADFDNDGFTDFLGVNTKGLALFRGSATGTFLSPLSSTPLESLRHPSALTSGDIDHDGDLDLWLAQYRSPYRAGQMPTPYYRANDGYPSYLLRNDGTGRFVDVTEEAGLTELRFRRTYSASLVDLEDDGDQDLVTVNDFAGLDFYVNDGTGRFRNASDELAGDRLGFGMAHAFGDFDRNGELDLFMIGMNDDTARRLDYLKLTGPRPEYALHRAPMTFGNRLFYRQGARYHQLPAGKRLAESGWSWGVSTGDFDNDGDEDIHIVNGHISNASVRDYAPNFWLYDIYLGDSNENPALDFFFQSRQNDARLSGVSFGGHELNHFYLNRGQDGFLEVAYLIGLSLQVDCRNLISEDLDGDGRLEWLTATLETWPQYRHTLRLFANFTEPAGHWIGLRVVGAPELPIVGTVVQLKTPNGEQRRQLVTGESYRSQHANALHFGIGPLTEVDSLEIRWPDGGRRTLDRPEIDRWHQVVHRRSTTGNQ